MNATERGYTGTTQGETEGTEQDPTKVGDADPAVRDPRPGGPMTQPSDDGTEGFRDSRDAAYGQRRDQGGR